MSALKTAMTVCLGMSALCGRIALASVDLVVGDDVTAKNCQADVVVTMSTGGATVAGVQMDLLYPTGALELANAAAPCVLAAGLPGSVTAQVTTSPPPPAGSARLRLVLVDFGGDTYGDGPVATCRFKPTAGSTPGVYAITTAGAAASDNLGNGLPTAGIAGEVTITAPAFCCP